MREISAGLIIYRKKNGAIEFFVGHPGGPYWKNQEFFTFLKGRLEEDEDLLSTAIREVKEECGITMPQCNDSVSKVNYVYLGSVKQTKKTVHAFLIEHDFDEKTCYSNMCHVEYPYKSGNIIEIPEIDEYRWVTYEELTKITHIKHLPLYEKAIDIIEHGKLD